MRGIKTHRTNGWLVAVLAGVAVVLLIFWWSFFRQRSTAEVIKVGEEILQVEVVRTPQALSKGLSGRTVMPHDGMLFVLPSVQPARFWMKDMLFDLDFVWIVENRVVEVTEYAPRQKEGQRLSELSVYSPKQPVKYVLELPAGDVRKRGIVVGDQFELVK